MQPSVNMSLEEMIDLASNATERPQEQLCSMSVTVTDNNDSLGQAPISACHFANLKEMLRGAVADTQQRIHETSGKFASAVILKKNLEDLSSKKHAVENCFWRSLNFTYETEIIDSTNTMLVANWELIIVVSDETEQLVASSN